MLRRHRTVVRLLVLAAVAAAFGTGSGTASAAVNGASTARTAATGDSCAGPCPSIFFAKGAGGGEIVAETVWSDGQREKDGCTLAPRGGCTLILSADPDLATGRQPETVVFRSIGVGGSIPAGWENCPNVVANNECRMRAGLAVAMCVRFKATAGEIIPDTDCPPPSVQLYKKGDGQGTVTTTGSGAAPDTCGPLCPGKAMTQWIPGEAVTLTAAPAAGASFVRWDGCPTPQSGNTCTFTLTRATTICAVFVPTGSAATDDLSCPWSTPKYIGTPKPPPATAPRLGSKCTIPGSPDGDAINGTARKDVLCGRGGNDRLNGRGSHDLLLGGAGNDRLYGHAGNDRLRGDGGNDALYGGAGTDILEGGGGRDVVYARGDRARDTVSCGLGRDVAYVDRLDRVRGCEVVRRA